MNLTPTREVNLYVDEDMDTVEIQELAGGSVAVFSARAPGKVTPNEDSAAVIPCGPDSAVIAVADGVGGAAAGERASARAVEFVQDAVQKAHHDGELMRSAIINAIEHANQEIQNLPLGAATTLAVIEIQGAQVRPYHVGDSMILMVGQRGKVKLQTISHSPVGYAVESGLIDEKEAMHHEDRHLVSNLLGTSEMRIDLGPIVKLSTRDTIVLASDGLFDNLSVEEIVDSVRKGPLLTAVDGLVGRARKRMEQSQEGQPSKPDDLTAVVFRPGKKPLG